MAEASSVSVLENLMRWLVALAGWFFAWFMWKARSKQIRKITDNTEVNKAIDTSLDKIEKLEDLVIAFWRDKDGEVVPEQLTSAISNCAFYTRQITNLQPSRPFPTKELAEVRKSATMNMEQATRGIDQQRQRLGRFVRTLAKLRRAEVYEKRPFSE
jgi:hypothetical protein